MNAVQLYNRTLGYIDTARNPRFGTQKVYDSINTAIDHIVKEKYEAGVTSDGQKGFEVNQRMKDELNTLIRTWPASILATKINLNDPKNNFVSKESITDFMYTIGLRVTISGNLYWTDPTTHTEKQDIYDDPYRRPSIKDPARIWRIENATGCEIHYGDIGSLTAGTYEYIKLPDTVDLGSEVTVGGSISSGITILALTDAVVDDGTVHTLKAGQEFIATSTTSITSGIVVRDFTNCDLPTVLHEEVARRAAVELNLLIENLEKAKALSQ